MEGASVYDQVKVHAKVLGIDLPPEELASFAQANGMGDGDLEAISKMFGYLGERKRQAVVATLLRTSRLPLKCPKTFDNFNFARVQGPDVGAIENLPALTHVYSRRNIAFIGPHGVGKTHLAMAYGRACCEHGMKTYFLKASELKVKFGDAVKMGREGKVVASLVKPSCLIIDEIGRCVFDKKETRLFFDMVDKRYEKEGPNLMIVTSNYGPDTWGEHFGESSTLLCSMDRIFDNATVFMMKGPSYRGEGLETCSVETLLAPQAPGATA